MKTLYIPRILRREGDSLESLSDRIERDGVWDELSERPWEDFPYKPRVQFGIAHTGESICIVYRVEEQAILAEKTETNAQVSEDSCVELFIAPASDGLYYNFEWSCIGTCLAGVGQDRYDRELLSPDLIAGIRRVSSLGTSPFPEQRGNHVWTLTVEIPVTQFARHGIEDLAGSEARGNLYKCGDHLSAPHYVTWKSIDSPAPDYHRPEQFGRFLFAD